MTVSTAPFRATRCNAPLYVIRKTTPWPSLGKETEWVNCSFDVDLVVYDQVAKGVDMRVPMHVTCYRRTRRSLDGSNSVAYEFIGAVTFNDDSVVTAHGTLILDTGTGAFDDISS